MLKPLCPYGPVQDLSVIEETSAYCWVDIVVNSADAWVQSAIIRIWEEAAISKWSQIRLDAER